MTDNDFIMVGYVDLTVDDVRTIARGCGVQSPEWLFPDVQTELNAETFAASVASLTSRGLIRAVGSTFELDAQIGKAVEHAATPGPAILVLSSKAEPVSSWLFVGRTTTSIFTRSLGSESLRLRQIGNSSLARAILALTHAPVTDQITSVAVELSAAEVAQVRQLLSDVYRAGADVDADIDDMAARLRSLDLGRLVEAFDADTSVDSVLFLRPVPAAVMATQLVWSTSDRSGLHLVEFGESAGITTLPITTEDLFLRLTSEVESLMTPAFEAASS